MDYWDDKIQRFPGMTGMIRMITVNGLTVITRMTRMAGMTWNVGLDDWDY